MQETSPSKQYTLTVDSGVSSAEISLQQYSTATMKNSNGEKVTSIKATPANNNVVFTVEGADYVNAVTNSTCTYQSTETTSQCNICFILKEDASFVWQATGKTGQGDNPTMFPDGTGSNTTEHKTATVTVQTITEANPNVPPSSAQVLRASQVFLVDWDVTNKNILVRGNSPLGAETSGGQTIDFKNLQDAIVSACEAASGPTLGDLGDYVLHDIALLSAAEEYIWANEYFSFTGNTGTPNSAKETWFPSTPTPLRGITSCAPTGQMGRWNVEPVDTTNGGPEPLALVNLVELLKSKMNEPSTGGYNVYYIHCASGHDRTGMVASTYLAYKSLTSSDSQGSVSSQIDAAFIYGTTLQYQDAGGGDIVQECYDIGTTNPSTQKSRCFLASDHYNKTYLTALATLVPPASGTTYGPLGADTTRTPSGETGTTRPYVIPYYPFPVAEVADSVSANEA